MKRALVVAVLALSLHAADTGKAAGKFVVDKSTTRALTHAYAVDRNGLLKVVLASAAVEEAELFDDEALQAAVGARDLSALVIELDADRKEAATFFCDPKLPAGLEVRTVTKFQPKKSGEGALAGRMTMKDPDFSFSFDSTFDAPIIVQTMTDKAPPAEEIAETPEALRNAVERGNVDVVKHLLERGVDKNTQDAYGQSLVMNAVSNHRNDIVKLLIDAGADINAPNQYRIAPLAVAAEQGHLDLVNMLVAAGAKVNARDTAGSTALSVAILRGYTEIVAALIEAGTDLQRDKEDLLALAADKPEIKAMLEAAMAKTK
ncbi:MAG TPA: ankyrin repeat domain-containing protein [Thermoanaerobaculia bacterium]|nr:ankyrin repeat domain-containing protein [Thermoanaerobaculia bacterium]